MPDIDVVLHPVLPPGVAAALAATAGIKLHQPADNAGVAAALASGAPVLVGHTWQSEFMQPTLRWMAGTGAGTDQYPLDQFRQRGVVLTTALGVHSACVAEHAFALLLSLTRRVGEAVRNMAAPSWQPLVGEELAGKRLAIVGLGRIGEEVAQRAQGWGLELIGIKRRPEHYRGCVKDVRGLDQLDAICDWADILLLCAPAQPDRSSLIGVAQLRRLGKGWLVNVGRGRLVDETALLHALQFGGLRGAALDVTGIEPLPADSPLWRLPQVVITAHNAGDSPGYGPRWGRLFERNLAAFIGSGIDWVNRADGGGPP